MPLFNLPIHIMREREQTHISSIIVRDELAYANSITPLELKKKENHQETVRVKFETIKYQKKVKCNE